MIEEWRTIEGFERYEVSNLGRVRFAATHHVRTLHANYKGYFQVSMIAGPPAPRVIGVRTRPLTRKVHRLVALAFVPNPNGLPEVNHLDFDKQNNVSTNLEWVSARQNMLHSIEAGRQTAITNPNKRYKLSPEDVATIRAEYVRRAKGRPGNLSALAARFNVNTITIIRIANGKTWYDPSAGIPAPPPKRPTRTWRRPKRTQTASDFKAAADASGNVQERK